MASVPAAGWMGVLACILSSVSAIFLIFLDSKDSRKTCGVYITEEEEPLLNDEQKESESIQDLGIPIHVENPSPNLDAEVIRNPVNIGLPSQNDDLAQFLLKPGEAHGVDNSHGEDDESSYDSEEYEEEDEIPHITQFAGISLPFWLLFINTIALYGKPILCNYENRI